MIIEWILIVLYFTGPTSADGYTLLRFPTKAECEAKEVELENKWSTRKIVPNKCFGAIKEIKQ